MNPEIKERWLEKLESGKYAQTTGELSGPNGYCCLGVLCEVAVEDGIIKRKPDDGYIALVHKDGGEEYYENALLPTAVVEWAQLDSCGPEVPFEDNMVELASLNDNIGLTFPEIAKLIREHL